MQMVEVDWKETMSGVDGVYDWKIEKENAMLQKRRKELEQEKRK